MTRWVALPVGLLVGLPCVLPLGVPAQPAQGMVAREIEGLFAALEFSGCAFQRNGTWHDAARARAHLRRKYDYLRERDAVPTAERFIERAATRSSVTGRAYAVRCGKAPPVPASRWFGAQLEALRARRTP